MRKHKAEEDIKNALLLPKALQNKFFDDKRREGVYDYNLQLMSKQEDEDKISFMRERNPKYEDQVRMCSGCKSFLSNKSYYKHRQNCANLNAEAMNPKLLITTPLHKDANFTAEILNRFRSGKAGDLCRKDPIIQQVGYRHFCLRQGQEGMEDEVRKCVMGEMRELARLALAFKSLAGEDRTVEDMFTRKNLPTLREAIQQMAQIPDDHKTDKHALKLNFNAIINRTIKSLKGYYSVTMQDDKYEEIGKFQLAYAFGSAELFASARYKCISNSFNKVRRPENLPEEDELKKLQVFIAREIEETVENFEIKKYAWLRTLVVSRLTLYNGRRGEEPSRMLLSQWDDAENGVWLPKDQVEAVEDPAERYLIGQFQLAYLHGKGQKFVHVIIPLDVVEAVRVLVRYREKQDIRANNIFVFATKHSKSHCSGWHAVRDVCVKGRVTINATRNRHRLSTIYASLDMTPEHQKVFLDHIGHEAAINRDNYQCPIGLKEVIKVFFIPLHVKCFILGKQVLI